MGVVYCVCVCVSERVCTQLWVYLYSDEMCVFYGVMIFYTILSYGIFYIHDCIEYICWYYCDIYISTVQLLLLLLLKSIYVCV